ncbi:MAG TPA: zinc-dependent metalloprotease family protein [Tepidisphaeraceae bacterium]|nr:zinc-dependent metalloprotease family protein [Tepidisphaeraceae bacterium]
MRAALKQAAAYAAIFWLGALIAPPAFAQLAVDADAFPAPSLAPAPIVLSGPTYPLSSLPAFNSRTGANANSTTATLYLDFDGDSTTTWGAYSPGTTKAYDIDGDPNTFSQQELDNINEICQRVAEAYSPFNINVTTVAPASLDHRVAARIVVGGTGDNGNGSYWYSAASNGKAAGGIAYVQGFTRSFLSTTGYVFSSNLANGTPKYSAVAIAHEAGHLFGLEHQSVYDESGFKTAEYNPGTSDKAPTMGVSYFSARSSWWDGPSSTGFSDAQIDVDVISYVDTLNPGSVFNNGFGYATDEAGDDINHAKPLVVDRDVILASGVITKTSDIDFYSFSVINEGDALFNLQVAPFGAMLDGSLALYSADGTLLDLQATATLGEQLLYHLVPGTYDLAVMSAGNVGDIGQYVLDGALSVPEPVSVLLFIGTLPFLRRRR